MTNHSKPPSACDILLAGKPAGPRAYSKDGYTRKSAKSYRRTGKKCIDLAWLQRRRSLRDDPIAASHKSGIAAFTQ